MRDFSLIKKNILQYIDKKRVSKYEFYQKTGISNGILSQTNGMSEENILKFLNYYKDINVEWLLTGKGEMLINSNRKKEENLRLIPLYDSFIYSEIDDTADITSVTHEPTEYINAGDWFKDADAAMRIHSDSMHPYYYVGSIIPLKLIKNIKLIIYGSDYMIETDEYRIVKRILKGTNKEAIMAFSTNTVHIDDGSDKGRLMFEPFEIKFNDIRRLFLVLGSVSRNHSSWIK